jgi:hypothetical protein
MINDLFANIKEFSSWNNKELGFVATDRTQKENAQVTGLPRAQLDFFFFFFFFFFCLLRNLRTSCFNLQTSSNHEERRKKNPQRENQEPTAAAAAADVVVGLQSVKLCTAR